LKSRKFSTSPFTNRRHSNSGQIQYHGCDKFVDPGRVGRDHAVGQDLRRPQRVLKILLGGKVTGRGQTGRGRAIAPSGQALAAANMWPQRSKRTSYPTKEKYHDYANCSFVLTGTGPEQPAQGNGPQRLRLAEFAELDRFDSEACVVP